MSIKSDNWIRRMAREHGMIEPFAPEQVRYVDGHKIVSYGTSSYGYDVRCAGEFKIFTNINSTIVDPKGFDEKSFVDLAAEVCVIPPNSFALARTVEYFRIPRNVLTVCLGKSTYARCFRGDTRVALVDGQAATLEDMARRHESGERFWGYSIAPNGRLIVTLLEAPRYIGRDALLEIELDNGARIHATADHPFMRRDGRMAEAHALRPGQALMPLYRDLVGGHEAVYQPMDAHRSFTRRLAAEWILRHGIYADRARPPRHHMDPEPRNTSPIHLAAMAAAQDIRVHHGVNLRQGAGVERYGATPRAAATALRRDRSALRPLPEGTARSRITAAYRNHKIIAIREVPGDHDVYCLSVPEAGNFAIEAGVFVHNCGIIVNVTPLEPEWEGHVTLEFSNTTPLPAKIYANEGVAQMLFFESDEVCSTSYKDRGGKYQGQRGVTLPKT